MERTEKDLAVISGSRLPPTAQQLALATLRDHRRSRRDAEDVMPHLAT